ncbi:MAG: Eco57I restriction-modification methylase domain-containing protein [Candidatus Komeilibacteria bacterium]
MSKEILKNIITDFSLEKFDVFFREKSTRYKDLDENLEKYDKDFFKSTKRIGYIDFGGRLKDVCVIGVQSNKDVTERLNKKAQYDFAKSLLKQEDKYEAGIFIFYDSAGNFRFSLIYPQYSGAKRVWNNFKRYTYFVSEDFNNKTFLQQIGNNSFNNIEDIKEAFSLSKVTRDFYQDFYPRFKEISKSIEGSHKASTEKKDDFTLLFIIRIIFLGFIQKRGWLAGNIKFLQNYLKEYLDVSNENDTFYSHWLKPLFFQTLNSAPGKKIDGEDSFVPADTKAALEAAPYLNGGLFREKDIDKEDLFIPDKNIIDFFDFLFSYNFTIEENTRYDEELELNPEFLGIIFERLVNKEDGAIYTPKTEVDLMCRISLVKWLHKNNTSNIDIRDLYELFFIEGGTSEEYADQQKYGSFSKEQYENILDCLEKITICDPAVGSGAFPVGMLQVINEIEEHIYNKLGEDKFNTFERKKRIIGKSLYGVEVKEWAVWITQLRLWITLFIDAPDEMKNSIEPILPSLDFKIRPGDSLVQRVGNKTFPVTGHAFVSQKIKRQVTELKNLKIDYFYNKKEALKKWKIEQSELQIYRDILDDEIKILSEEIKNEKNIKESSQQPFSFSREEKDDKIIKKNSIDKEKIKCLEDDIKELESQKSSLKDNKPLVWNIEFAEIFVEKEGFDIVIGNPPYVRQESISDPTGNVKNQKDYKNFLQEMVRLDFPNDFSNKTKINAQSDLYTYFYIRGLRLLNPNGIHTYICSSSWLDVAYGSWLQDFLLKRCPIEFIIDNNNRRSFKEADVNTVISVINAPQKKVEEDRLTKFVVFKKPFEETIFTENLLHIEKTKKIVSNDSYRIYPITAENLREPGIEYENDEQKKLGGKYIGDKWGGKYLRAPDIFFTILNKGENKLVKLGGMADIKFGIKTGANDFFYLTEEEAKKLNIEDEFLIPVVKSPRECKSILIRPNDLKYRLFVCNKNKDELCGSNALKYIEWGEKEKITIKQGANKGKVIIGFQNIPTIKGRKRWWDLGEHIPSNFLWTMTYRERFFVVANTGFLADARMYDMYCDNYVGALCNSTITLLQLELMARGYGGGGGPVDVKVYEVKNLLLPDLKDRQKELNDTLTLFKNRDIKSIFDECGIDPKLDISIEKQNPKPLSDRAKLDSIIFDSLNLSSEERKEVYRVVCRLVWNRINKASSL